MIKLLKKVRYLSSVSLLYGVTLLLLWQGAGPLIPTDVQAQQTKADAKPVVRQIISYPKKIAVKSGVPIKIIIPKLQIDKEVLPGIYDADTSTWTLSDIGIHYAHPSDLVNDYAGNTLLYGHNHPVVLGKLQHLTPGDTVQIVTDNSLRFTYVYQNAKDFDPNDTSIFAYQGPPTLTLQTCSGYWNEARRLYSFSFQKVENL